MDCFLMRRRPPKSTRTDTLFPNATLRRSPLELGLDGRLVGLPALLLEVRPAHADDEVLRLGGPVQDWGAEGGRGDQKRRGQGTCHSAHGLLPVVPRRSEIGRASCRERVCQYV